MQEERVKKMKAVGEYKCACGNLRVVLWSSAPGKPVDCERCGKRMTWTAA